MSDPLHTTDVALQTTDWTRLGLNMINWVFYKIKKLEKSRIVRTLAQMSLFWPNLVLFWPKLKPLFVPDPPLVRGGHTDVTVLGDLWPEAQWCHHSFRLLRDCSVIERNQLLFNTFFNVVWWRISYLGKLIVFPHYKKVVFPQHSTVMSGCLEYNQIASKWSYMSDFFVPVNQCLSNKYRTSFEWSTLPFSLPLLLLCRKTGRKS